jgi:excisionase family DNA binding protein
MSPAGGLLTARELAGTLGVSTGALLRWTRAGRVPAVKLPSGAVRYRPEQIEQWLNEQTTKAGDADEEREHPGTSPADGYSPRSRAPRITEVITTKED